MGCIPILSVRSERDNEALQPEVLSGLRSTCSFSHCQAIRMQTFYRCCTLLGWKILGSF